MRIIFSILISLLLVSCNSTGNNTIDQTIHYEAEDKEILNQIFSFLADVTETPISVLMVKVGIYFLETPYVAHTLEIDTIEEDLVINLRELDCTTFAENCLAISRTLKSGEHSFEKFADELRNIRYRNGEIENYTSRLHYFSDWIFDNDLKNISKSVSKDIAQIQYQKEIDFMSTHTDSYIQLKNNPVFINIISEQEKKISKRETYFISEENFSLFKNKLRDGDIVGITTNIKGLDILHVGIILRKAGKVHLLHASTDENKVVVSKKTLENYLLESKSATGIMVSRPESFTN